MKNIFLLTALLFVFGSSFALADNNTNSTNLTLHTNGTETTFGMIMNTSVSCQSFNNTNTTCNFVMNPIQVLTIRENPININQSILNTSDLQSMLLQYCVPNMTNRDDLIALNTTYNMKMVDFSNLNVSLYNMMWQRDTYYNALVNVTGTYKVEQDSAWQKYLVVAVAAAAGMFVYLRRKTETKARAGNVAGIKI